MGKDIQQELINFRYGLAFHKLIESNKRQVGLNKKKGVTHIKLDDSYGKLSSSTGLRPATISAIVGGQSDVKGSTVFLLLNALGKTYTQFGRLMDKITDEDVLLYKNLKEEEKTK